LVWGAVLEHLHGDVSPERILAVTPGMTALTLLFAFMLYRGQFEAERWRTIFVAAAVGVWLLGWLLTLKIGTFSGFWLVRYLVPGALGIRAGMRIQLVTNIWIVLALVVLLDCWLRSALGSQRRRRTLVAAAALAFCLIEQINLMNNSRIHRSAELAALAQVPPPPPACQAFFVRVRPNQPYFFDQADAMLISQRTGLPTLNGLAAWMPPGWTLFRRDVDQAVTVREWIAHSGLRDQVCAYDTARREWALFR
jgi:hypothetical protein